MIKAYIVGCFLFVGQLASAYDVYNLNNETDELLTNVNNEFTKMGFGSIPLSDQDTENYKLSGGNLVGFNSFERIGDAIAYHSEDKNFTRFDLHIGHRLLVPSYGRIQFRGEDITGLTWIRNNSFHLAVSIVNPFFIGCSVTADHYEWVAFGNAIFRSNVKKYDGMDISLYTEYALPLVNFQLFREKYIIERELEQIICQKKELPRDQQLSNIIRTAILSHKLGVDKL